MPNPPRPIHDQPGLPREIAEDDIFTNWLDMLSNTQPFGDLGGVFSYEWVASKDRWELHVALPEYHKANLNVIKRDMLKNQEWLRKFTATYVTNMRTAIEETEKNSLLVATN